MPSWSQGATTLIFWEELISAIAPGLDMVGGSTSSGDTAATTATTFAGPVAVSPETAVSAASQVCRHTRIEPPVSMKQPKLLHTSSHHISLSMHESYGNPKKISKGYKAKKERHPTTQAQKPVVPVYSHFLQASSKSRMLCVRKGKLYSNGNLSYHAINSLWMHVHCKCSRYHQPHSMGSDSCLAACQCLIRTCKVQAELAA